ncbi:MAG: hypothetical protein IT183_02215 [Acidobacteria bacterium]|nr:hypothetical protein [Acidobacteriota bacterium]
MSTNGKPSDSSARTSTPGQRVSHGLVALSSAVVMAVYAAGYLRTQAAADRFEAEAGQRRPVAPIPAPAVAGASEPASPTAVEAPVATAAVVEGSTTKTVAAPAPEIAAALAAPPTQAPVANPGPSRATTPAAAATVVPPVTEAAAAVTAPEAAPAVATANATATPVPVAPAAPAVPAAPRYKDGTYTGWGTSRHGDIEAQVIIVNGRITSATIKECMTRWPCSWIEALPGQVVARQSPETDFVSGATQSTNAFYYAVVQALGKAALP